MKLLSGQPISFDLGLLIMRIVMGATMLTHGWPKFQKILDGNFKFGDPIGIGEEASLILAVFSELVCSVLIVLGFATRLATIPLIITMLVAFFIVHGADSFGSKEKAVLYLASFLTLFFTGPGRYAVDK